MRVAAAGWLFDTLDKTLEMAKVTAEVTHNHPEGIKGAVAVAGCIYRLRVGASKEDVRAYASRFYDLNFTLDDIRERYTFDVSCAGSVPQAIEAFLEGGSFTGVISNAISIGGDSDTLAAITGAIAEAYYGVPDELWEQAKVFMDDGGGLADTVERFYTLKDITKQGGGQ